MPSSHNGHISITGVSKYYGRHKALDDVSLEIPPGTVTVILGPSGSGKSTLLRTINHLERVDEGFIQIDGDYIGYRRKGDKLYEMKEKEILRQRINVGYVFQNFNLFPHLTVLENLIEAPIAHQQVTRKEAIARAYELLDVVGLRNKADAWSRHLSGGQQQRIGVARAFAMDPGIILMDEPFSALDPITRSQLQDELVNLQAKLRKTIVFVTHDMDEAVKIADRICILHSGDILQYDTPENILKNPADGFVSEFVGSKRIWSSPELIKAKDIMIRTPKITYPDVPMLKCIEKMRIENVDSLLVVDESEHLLGIIRARSIHAAPDKSEPVHTVMKPAQATADPNENIVALLKKVNSNNISNVPVVDENKRLLGLITNSSLVTTMSQQFIDFEEGEA